MEKTLEKQVQFVENAQKQLSEAFKQMEDLRWKFVAGFGLVAVGSVVAAAKAPNRTIEILSAVLSIFIALAALMCLSRVYALAVRLWNRIGACQRRLMSLHSANDSADRDQWMEIVSLCLPPFKNPPTWDSYLVTVHHACSLVFCAIFASMAAYSLVLLKPEYFTATTGVLVGFILFVTVDIGQYFITRWAAKDISFDKEDENWLQRKTTKF